MTTPQNPWNTLSQSQAEEFRSALDSQPGLPNQDELSKMIDQFGQLPEWAYKKPFKEDYSHPSGDPLQGYDIDFGMKHKPTSYTLDIMQEAFWFERGLFFEDIPYIAQSKVPMPEFMIVTFRGLNKNYEMETKLLRVNFEKDDEGKSWGAIVNISAENNTTSEVPKIEIACDIESIEVIEGTLYPKEADNG